MSLKTIVRVVGGDLYDGGRRANIPAPGHSPRDRSVSLLLEGDRVLVHAFGGADWREVLDHLRALRLIDAVNAPLSVAGFAPPAGPAPATRQERQAVTRLLWEAGRPIHGAASERYCRTRGLVGALPGADVLRHHAAAPVSVYRRVGAARPAMLAAIRTADGALTAVEVTYLTALGRRATDLRLSRKTVGLVPAGCAIRLGAPAATMVVGEGVFTALSAGERFGLPAWALGSARNLRAWRPPEDVRTVLIAADRGLEGESCAEQLRAGLARAGVAARLALPPEPFGDWNEWSVAAGAVSGLGTGGERQGRGGRAVGQDGPRPGAGA